MLDASVKIRKIILFHTIQAGCHYHTLPRSNEDLSGPQRRL